MEFFVELNFKFDDKAKETELGELFKSVCDGDISSEDELDLKLREAYPELPIEVGLFLEERMFDDLIEHLESVSLQAKKVCMEAIGPTGSVEHVIRFMNFIVALGGKPLTCRATEDESVMIFKHTKNGITATEKERDESDY